MQNFIESWLGWEMDVTFSWFSVFMLLLPLAQRLVMDWIVIVKMEQEPDHGKHTALTAVLIIIMSLVVAWRQNLVWYDIYRPACFAYAWFILLFDYGLNISRRLHPLYIDQGIDGRTNWADAIYVRLGPLNTLFLKLFLFHLLMAICYFSSYVGRWTARDWKVTLITLAVVGIFFIVGKRLQKLGRL